ncbi:SIR2 family protein [Paenibacillus dokdonensis]|uniref:SIR2 family protein n=1 Tax=Paenibacillus dokdonensis TaxID=2567944 RepID=A0ABU6GSK0_9BACL|nr:SIR2 family protein [Paenibacillus dokdonensis]MEC0241271.1 SIR2 family protein [Paenibacillus dokdonensis]
MTEKISMELEQYLKQIAESLKANRCSVLVGAGFSRNADSGSLFAPSFPTWNELADAFYEKLYSSKPEGTQYLNPLTLAEQVEAAYGRAVLNQLLISRIPDAQYSPSILHTKLLSLPWRDIFTTNYDTLLERACQEITNKRFNIINCKEDLVSSSDAPRIVKLHGTFPSHRPFIITSEDYRRYPREFAPFINTVQQSLLENTLCLIGFSGDDPNFNQWIGWIHDNLGLENSPQIYLFFHGDYPHAQKKLLDHKKVIVVNISSFASEGNPREKYEGLLDYLLESVRTAQPVWPEFFDFYNEEHLPFSKAISILQQIRIAYPGWLVPSNDIRERALILRRGVESLLQSVIKEQKDEELSLLYEYDWLREKCLRPPFQWELEFYSLILERNPGTSADDQQMRLSIQISLLRDLRESGDFEAWNSLFKQIESQSVIMKDEQLNRFSYERCLFSMFNFDHRELKNHLHAWIVNEQSPEWVLRKSGLLAECNELLQAQELLQNSLILIRRQLQSDDQNLLLLSYESALMSLKGFIEQSISMENDFEQSWSERWDTEHERRQIHKKFTTDWNTEDERFQLLLTAPRQDFSSKAEQPSFDFGRRTLSVNSKNDTDALTAYAFLRFREETGHPFRVHNITSGNKAAIGAAERIATYSFAWASVTIARANEEKAAEAILSRSALYNMTAIRADELCQSYLGALHRTMGELHAVDWYYSKSFAEFSAKVLPLLLSQLCCKCTLPVLDEMLQFLLEIYQSDYRLHYKNVEKWICRLISAFTKTQQLERIPIFLKFPLLLEENRIVRGFPDPIIFLNIPTEKPIPVVEIVAGTENVFVHATSSPELQLSALERLIILSCNGLLTQEQDERLGNLLWQDNFIKPADFNRTISLMLPHPATIDPRECIRTLLLTDLQERVREGKTSISDRDSLLDEFHSGIFRGIFTIKDIPVLLPNLEVIQNRLVHHFGDTSFFNADSIARRQLFQIVKMITRLLLISTEWCPSNSEYEIMERILDVLRKNQLTHPFLEFLWAKKYNVIIDVKETIFTHLFMGSFYQKLALYDTAILLIEYKERDVITQEEVHHLFTLIAQQILWRNNEHLVSAINVMHEVVRLSPETISVEIEHSLLRGLCCLQVESKFTENDALDAAVPKGELRVASARLANIMIQNFRARNIPIPDVLRHWENIYNCPDEFSEIRNAID